MAPDPQFGNRWTRRLRAAGPAYIFKLLLLFQLIVSHLEDLLIECQSTNIPNKHTCSRNLLFYANAMKYPSLWRSDLTHESNPSMSM